MDMNVFFWRKNVVVSKLDFALEVLAAALCIELDFMRLREMGFVFVLMVVAMQARLRRLAEAPRQVMLCRAVVEFHVPTHGDEKHHKGQQHSADLQQSFFHGRKGTKLIKMSSEN